MNASNKTNPFFRLVIMVSLILGTVLYLPALGNDGTALADVSPPPDTSSQPEGSELPATDLSPDINAQPSPQEVEFNETMALLEQARIEGPRAVADLQNLLQGSALELVLDEIVLAQELLVQPFAPEQPNAPTADRTVGSVPCTYSTIAAAIAASKPGDRLLIEGGVTFKENITINLDLILEGGYSGCGSGSSTRSTVAGITTPSSVFDVLGGNVIMRNLNITGGDAPGGGVDVLGGNVTLDNSQVYGNNGNYGGGLYINQGCTVTATNDSDVYNNTATIAGGGAYVLGTFNGVENFSDIYENSAPDGGGMAVPGGIVNLNTSDMYLNEATAANGKGGGIYLTAGGALTMSNSTYIYYLNQAYDGAGVYADNSTVHIESNSIFRDNIATNNGGAVYLTNNSTLTSAGGRIGQAGVGLENEAILGAGIYAITSTVDFEGYIYNNLASYAGAGIYAANSTVNLNNTQVGGTDPYQTNTLGPSGWAGAGLFLTNGTHATLDTTTIISNTLPATAIVAGGGAMVREGSVLTMTNSTIARHSADSTFGGRGAGIYISDGTVTLDNSQVISNTAFTAGGGIRMFGVSTLNMLNNSLLQNNDTTEGEGGGIAAAGTPDINISDSRLYYNAAFTDGGAVYLDAGTLDFNGWWELIGNSAHTGDGGAVAVMGTGDVDFYANGTYHGYLYNNLTSAGNGGALYVGNSDEIVLNATSGQILDIYANIAFNDGGAIYADNGAVINIDGEVRFNSNWAFWGNGGALYITGDSQLWLDEANNYQPMFFSNKANNGGAIYAADGANLQCRDSEFGRYDNGNYVIAGDGGSIFLSGSTLNVNNCSFHHGEADRHGGAIAAYTSTLTIDADYLTCDPTAEHCSTLHDNTSDSDANGTGDGGAIYVWDSTLDIDHTTMYSNTAQLGGAIYQSGTGSQSGLLSNSLLYKNSAIGLAGSGIRVLDGDFTLNHVTLADNSGAPAYNYDGTGTNQAFNSIAWGNIAGGFTGTFTSISCNIDQNENAGTSIDPLFVSPSIGEDYHLQDTSPAVNACTTGLPSDLDDVSRPAGAGYDIGAYEVPITDIFLPMIVK